MYRLTLALAAVAALSVPAAAQSLSTLLPTITFPEPIASPATKGCTAQIAPICQIRQ